MATVDMKTLTIGDTTYKPVDEEARAEIEELQEAVENLGQGEDPSEAESYAAQAAASAEAAANSEIGAQDAKAAAESYSLEAKEYADAASNEADRALACANEANAAAQVTGTDKTEAAAAKTAAESAANSASASKTAAADSASTAASKATEATNAATSAANAKTAAETAQGAAEDAQEAAETAASTATSKASAAATSATNAANSASTATSKASAAATSATNAANSATEAAESVQSAADNAEVAFNAKERAEEMANSASNYMDAARDYAAQAEAAAGGGVPDYVLTEAERVAAAVQGHQGSNTVTFLACSDIHYSTVEYAAQMAESLAHLGQGMALVRERVAVDFAACLGDSIWDATGETVDDVLEAQREVNAALFDAFNGIPNFRLIGNHEAHYNGSTKLTMAQIFANTSAFNSGAVFDEANRAGGYCYRDFEEKKLRVVCLNTSEGDTSGGYTMSTEQRSWLADALDLTGLGEGWRSLILSHIPLDWMGANSAPLSVVKAADGVLCNVHGHVHNYLEGTLEGTTIPRFAIPNGCFYRSNEYGENGTTEYNGMEFGETTTYGKTAGTANDTAFCVVTIDLDGLVAYADHYGAGYSRDITLPALSVGPSYTNLVPTALAFDGSGDVFNGTGYMDGKYLSTSSPYYNTDSSTVTVGLIPWCNYVDGTGYGIKPPTIYVKGVSINMSGSHDRIGYGQEGKPYPIQTKNASTWSEAFTVTQLADQYYKLEPITTDSDNATHATWGWNYAQYIAFSFTGTGENLIITLDEPIE